MTAATGVKNYTQSTGKVDIYTNKKPVRTMKKEARMPADALDIELAYFNKIRGELLERAKDEYALIHGEELIGTFKSQDEAIKTGYTLYINKPFLVKKITAIDTPLFFTSNLIVGQSAK